MKETRQHRYSRLITAALAMSFIAYGVTPPSASHAQQTPPAAGQALEISPPVINISANPGETVDAQIKLRDISDNALIVSAEINDFTAQDELGTPNLLLDEGEASPYSMRQWFDPIQELSLKPREIVNLPVSINVPVDASPGGYYSVVRFTARAPELSGTGVSLSASLGALVFLQVNGDVQRNLSIEEFYATQGDTPSQLFQSAPITFVARIKNDGNIHERPTGKIVITDMFGKTIASINVNLEARNILPESIRRFEQSLDSSVIGNKMLFGVYNATLSLDYGEGSDVIQGSIRFWVIPYVVIGIVISSLIIAFFTFRILIRRYNNYIIKQAHKRR